MKPHNIIYGGLNMKSDKTGRIITILYCIAAGIVSISTLIEFIVKYSSFGA